MNGEPYEIEPWTYTVDGVDILGRRVWHVPSPGPTGCGVLFQEIDVSDVLADDNVWERHVYAWKPCLGFEEAGS